MGVSIDPKTTKPAKIYRALINQNGTDDPTLTVLENTLGFNFIPLYQSAGNYLLQGGGHLIDPLKACVNIAQPVTIDGTVFPVFHCYAYLISGDILIKQVPIIDGVLESNGIDSTDRAGLINVYIEVISYA